MKLLQEIQDIIFLNLDYISLDKTRELQSDYIKKVTQRGEISKVALDGNLENMKWLKEQGCTLDTLTFVCAVQNGNLENVKWLKEQGCPETWWFNHPARVLFYGCSNLKYAK